MSNESLRNAIRSAVYSVADINTLAIRCITPTRLYSNSYSAVNSAVYGAIYLAVDRAIRSAVHSAEIAVTKNEQ